MTIKVFHSDAWEWMKSQPDKSIDHIITDMVYGDFFNINECIRICKGNILTFCASEDYRSNQTKKHIG